MPDIDRRSCRGGGEEKFSSCLASTLSPPLARRRELTNFAWLVLIGDGLGSRWLGSKRGARGVGTCAGWGGWLGSVFSLARGRGRRVGGAKERTKEKSRQSEEQKKRQGQPPPTKTGGRLGPILFCLFLQGVGAVHQPLGKFGIGDGIVYGEGRSSGGWLLYGILLRGWGERRQTR